MEVPVVPKDLVLESSKTKDVESEIERSPAREGSSPEQKRQETESPEPTCAICLGKPENKSFTDSCFHTFCFTCLLEWSKVKTECPLCKQGFKSIIHSVKSVREYDQYFVSPNSASHWQNSADGRRFRYPTTMTSERRRHLAFETSLEYHSHRQHFAPHTSPADLVSPHYSEYHYNSSSNYRRYAYDTGLWLDPGTDSDGRYRDTSPTFYMQNPACTHRLIPWLNRELLALLDVSQVAFALEVILALISRYDIRSPEFAEHVGTFFHQHTSHFVHEFYNFARSPYDMAGHDRRSVYRRPESFCRNSDSDNSVVEVQLRTEVGSRPKPPCGIISFLTGETSAGVVHAWEGVGRLRSPSSQERLANTSDSDSDCRIVGCIKPRCERTPEVIDIASSGDEGQSRSLENLEAKARSKPAKSVPRKRRLVGRDEAEDQTPSNGAASLGPECSRTAGHDTDSTISQAPSPDPLSGSSSSSDPEQEEEEVKFRIKIRSVVGNYKSAVICNTETDSSKRHHKKRSKKKHKHRKRTSRKCYDSGHHRKSKGHIRLCISPSSSSS